MPPVVAAIAAFATEAATATTVAFADFIGWSAAAAVGTVVGTGIEVGIYAGFSIGVGLLTAPKPPSPAALQTPLKQSMPIRQSAFGRVRVSGPFALFAAGEGGAKTVSNDVLALLDGQSAALINYYLNDDLMAQASNGFWYAPGAKAKYGAGGSNLPNLVQLDRRLGLPTETAYPISGNVPYWTSDHRGDGVTSMVVVCKQANKEDQASCYPNGVPSPSAVLDSQLIFDPRDGTQTQGTASTYKFSDNPALCWLAYLTDASGGMGLDYTRFLAPTISYLTAAANECDGLVSTSGMHATLLDAANAGDHKIFLADTTGLAAGVTITLPTETVTVTGLATGGEVDIAPELTYAHSAGELAYWDASGQQARYRCAGTYRHDNAPGDVIKNILSTFDGWCGQRGDGALVLRTNTLYAPSVTLTDRHIAGYSVQHYLPDEQVVNQLIVSYTDPASAFNQAEAGYVQDDTDIAARGQVRSQTLQLDWVPSGPQAISVARAVLARSTQPLRGTVTCNLAGLAVLGERYVRLEISELPALNDVIVEVTGKPTIDLSAMTVSFPWVATNARLSSNAAICFAIDLSTSMAGTRIANMKAGMANALALIGSTLGAVDVAVVAFGKVSGVALSEVKRVATAADLADLNTWVQALTATADDTDFRVGMTSAKAFFDATDAAITTRTLIWMTDGEPTSAGIFGVGGDPPATIAAGAQAILAAMSGVNSYAMNIELTDTTWTAYCDNTPVDGVPVAPSATDLTAYIEQALFGSVSSSGSGYTVPPLGPPSGAVLDPLTAPTITSVTPDYPSSGGGVSGARLSIVVVDPGLGDVTWKIQWKLHSDSVWTSAGDNLTASSLTLVTGLLAASGSVDVQVAYITARQTSPWSATSTVTVSAPTAPGPLTVGFCINSGTTGTSVAPRQIAPHSGTLSKCKLVVQQSDPATDLIFTIKKGGTSVFSASNTVTHGAAAGSLSTFTNLTSSPLSVAADDLFTIDITSGSSAWQFTVQLET